MKILWNITGAGHLLDESIEILELLARDNNIITIATSKAADEVIALYGLEEKIRSIIQQNPQNSHIREEIQEFSYPFSGKLTHDKYDVIIIAPLTANTTAKIVCGIADTLITNIAAQSGKGQIPLILLPVDQKEGLITTIIPPYIDKKLCEKHSHCPSEIICPQDAINPPKIMKDKCINCKKCQNTCPNNAIRLDEKIELYIRKIDAQNTRKLNTIENVTTVYHPYDIPGQIKEVTTTPSTKKGGG